MSDDAAFAILSSRKFDARDLQSAAQREMRRENRLQSFAKQHREAARDPMTLDLVGWDENMAKASPWPWCWKCKTIVHAVHIEERETMAPAVVVRCHNGAVDGIRIPKPHRDVDKTDEGWLRRIIPNLVFFAK